MGSQWPSMGSDLFKAIKPFRDAIMKCHVVLQKEGFNLMNLINAEDKDVYTDPRNSFVGICAIQVRDCLIQLPYSYWIMTEN
jgi:acyl transferase domain-containing protein